MLVSLKNRATSAKPKLIIWKKKEDISFLVSGLKMIFCFSVLYKWYLVGLAKQKQDLLPHHHLHHLFPQYLKSHSLPPVVPGLCRRHEWGSCRCRHTEEHKHRLALTLHLDITLEVPLSVENIIFSSVIKSEYLIWWVIFLSVEPAVS